MRVIDARRGRPAPKGQEDLVEQLEQLSLPGFEAIVMRGRVKLRKIKDRDTMGKRDNGERGGS